MTTALIIVDVQHDFVSGSLGARGRARVIEPLDRLCNYADFVVSSMDWHPADHCSFSEAPTFEDGSWPVHCVAGTEGANLNPGLTWMSNEFVLKGTDRERESYSAFDGFSPHGRRSLEALLAERAVDEVWIGGLVIEKCVKATALSSVALGHPTTVVLDCCRGLDEATSRETVAELRAAGVTVEVSEALITTQALTTGTDAAWAEALVTAHHTTAGIMERYR